MEVIYCGVGPTTEYPGPEYSSSREALSALEASPPDIVVWDWGLGPFPKEFLAKDTGLVLVSAWESLDLYRTAVEMGCRQVLTTLEPGSLTAAIEAEWSFLQEQRRNTSCRSLFQQYGDHLKIHLWYDLIVDGRYKDLLEPVSYRLLLFHSESPGENVMPLAQKTDSPTIISGIFPEAVVILALQRPWECVVLPGDIRRATERASQCQAALSQRLGSPRKTWLSPPLLPGAIHGFYQQTLVEAMRSQDHSVSAMVREYIRTHLGEKLTRKTISDNLFFSPDYLAKVFLAETGVTMGAYICTTRLERAKEQLTRTTLPIGTIAAELGYQNFSEFSQWFKKQTGLVPSQFRKNNQ